MPEKSPPRLLYVDQFSSPQEARKLIERKHGFDNAVKLILTEAVAAMPGPTMLLAFCQSAITRATGLYDGVVREILASNPPAVFVLLRQLAETVAVARYVADKPLYVQALLRPESDWKSGEPRRKSVQALVDHMDKHYSSQFKLVYAELSELTHFGSTAVWDSHVIVNEEARKTIWSGRPVWRDERTLYIACAQLLELGAEMELALAAVAKTVVTEAESRTSTVGSFFDPFATE